MHSDNKEMVEGVAGKRGSCNKDSTTLVGRVGSAFLIDVELACRAGPERGRRGERGVGEQRPRAMHGGTGQTNVGDVGGQSTVGLLQDCGYESKARRSRRVVIRRIVQRERVPKGGGGRAVRWSRARRRTPREATGG